MRRRDLLKLAGASLLTPACRWLPDFASQVNEHASELPRETIYSGYRVGNPYVSTDAGIHVGGLAVNRRIKLANEIHSAFYSNKFDIKFFIPKLETHAYIQIADRPLQAFTSAPGNYFYGHAAIDEARGLLYTTQAKITKERDEHARSLEKGFVHIHSLPDMKEIGRLPSFGFDPHDMLKVNDTLVICNGGHNTSVVIVDLKSQTLLKEFKLDVSHLSLRHIDQIDPENFVVAPLTIDDRKPTPLYRLNTSTGLKRYDSPPGLDETLLLGQVLSVKHHAGYVYGTCPSTDSLVVWEARGHFVGGVTIPNCSNLSFSTNFGGMIVGSGVPSEPARLVKVSGGKLEISKIPWAVALTGAHSMIVQSV